MSQNKFVDNESKRTLCYYENNIIGIVDSLLKINDVYEIDGIEKPLICFSISDIPYVASEADNINLKKFNCEKIAYFYVNELVAKKLEKTYKKKTSQAQEKSLAKKIGGKVQIASGALSSFKGDVVHKKYLIEAKYSDSNEYRLALQTWNKIKKEAYEIEKLPLLEVCLDYSGKKPLKVIICSPNDLDVTMDEFVALFNSKEIKTDGKTILLKKEDFIPHIDYVNYNLQIFNPAFLITIKDILLIGIETDVFIKVFNV